MSEQIRSKREELAKRRDMLADAYKLIGDQRDDASEADILLHAERYDYLGLHPLTVLTSHQQRPGKPAEQINSNPNNFAVGCGINIPDRASFNPGFVVHHFGGPTAYSILCR